jgi:hypothetical protein
VPDSIDVEKAAACATPRGILFAGACYTKHQNTSRRGGIVKDGHSGKRPRVVSTRLELVATMCVEYDRHLQRWVIHADLPTPAHSAAAVYHRAKVYVLGGEGFREKRVDCLDTATDAWTVCPPMLHGRSSPSVVVVGDCLYAIEVTLNNVEVQCYDIASATWSLLKLSVDPTGRTRIFGNDFSAVALGTCVYMVGRFTTDCFKYDTKANTVTRIQSSGKRHATGAATVLGRHIILSGGMGDNMEPSRHIERYDPDTDTWELLPGTLPVPLQGHIMAA